MENKPSYDLRDELLERGVVWQVVGFAAFGIGVTSIIAIYSGADNVPFRFLDVATSKLSWAFIPTLAYTLDRSRDMFRKRSDIREAARQEVREEGAKEEAERIRKSLKAKGISIPPDVAEEIFNHKNGQD